MKVKTAIRSGDVQSIHRALDVLEAVGGASEIGTSELARTLGLAVSTVHSIVRTLAGRGYLVRGSVGYGLGPGAVVLASQWSPFSSLAPLVRPALVRLTEMTEHAATATVLVGNFVRLVGYEPAPGLVTASAGRDGPVNPLVMATGRLLVAMTREQDWVSLTDSPSGAEAEPGWSNAEWTDELKEIAETGLSIKMARDSHQHVLTAVGVPVCGPAHSVICSVGCSMPGQPPFDDLQNTLDALWVVAAELSQAIGGELPFAKPSIPERYRM